LPTNLVILHVYENLSFTQNLAASTLHKTNKNKQKAKLNSNKLNLNSNLARRLANNTFAR